MSKNNSVNVFWYSSNNFGDNLNNYLISKITNKIPIIVSSEEEEDKYMCIGSILNNDVKNCTVWGAGIAFENDVIPLKKRIISVRGKLSAYKTIESGNIFDGYIGDPALLLPMIYNPKIEKKYKLGIIPHYVDSKYVLDNLNLSISELQNINIKYINILDDVETVIDDILSCDKIISSSLHGLIAADAYNIPNKWCKFTDNIIGDDFKYFDYYSSIGISDPLFLDLRNSTSLEKINTIKNSVFEMKSIEKYIDLKKLWNSCPFLENNLNKDVKLSILICTIKGREHLLDRLLNTLNRQIDDHCLRDNIEILISKDEKQYSIGHKRNLLLDAAYGEWTAFIDDDDMVSDNYIKMIYDIIISNPEADVISLNGTITVDGKNPKKFIHSLKYDKWFEKDNIYYRPPNHLNPMRSKISKQFKFPEINHGEDKDWSMQIHESKMLKNEVYVNDTYYIYDYISNK